MDGQVFVTAGYGELIKNIEVYSSSGARVNAIYNTNYQSEFNFYLPNARGVYYIKIRTGNKIITKKVVKS
jgi:hypothetical protein